MILRLLLAFVCMALSTVHGQVTLALAQENPGAWRSGDGIVRPSSGNDGTRFDLTFASRERRLIADRPGTLDLSRYSSFRLRADVVNPDTIVEVKLSFKSGAGWYTSGFTLHHPGPQHLILPKALFKAEGSPGGWDKVDTLRISFWPRAAGSARVRFASLEGFQDKLWLIDARPSARGGDETYSARVTLWHMERILDNLGQPHGVARIDRLQDTRGASLILLPYAPRLTNEQVGILEERVRQGARLVVFESTNARLGRLLGAGFGNAQTSQTVGRFDRLAFATAGFPRLVYQHAWTIAELRPLEGATVLARWLDARGNDSGVAAALLHQNGAWFNAAWRSGDLAAKEEVLFALIRRFAPALVTHTETYFRETRSPRAFQQRFGVFPADSRPARNMRQQAERLASGDVDDLRALDRLLQNAHAASRTPWPAEIRGIWEQQGTGFYAGGWDETCRVVKEAGFNAIFANVSSAGRAHYPSTLLPASKTLEQQGDQLAAFVAAARKHGLQAHAWRINWKINNPDPAFLARMRAEGRLMYDDKGNEIAWLSPSHPDNLRFEADCMLEILDRAAVDGIQFDYMRYPGREADYGPAARRAFERESGRPVAHWPADVLGPRREEYQRFRQRQIHQAMEYISSALRARYPRVILSAAVWGAWPDCSIAQAQDWPVWAAKGWVDWIIPMNYTDNPAQFAGWLDIQRAQPGVARRLITGIGHISTNAELTSSQLLQQMEIAREKGTRGYVIYRLDSSLPERLFPHLRAGIHNF